MKKILACTLLVFWFGISTASAATQWAPAELPALTATQTHAWYDFPLQVTFTHAGTDERLIVDGYWDGGNRWMVRYALPRDGQWNWTATSTDPGLTGSGSINVVTPTSTQFNDNRNYRGHIQVGPTRRYFVHADGTPFLYVADTAWKMSSLASGLGHDNNNKNFYVWADDRTKKKFTVAQIAGFWDDTANEGGYPFVDRNWDAINPNHFTHTDTRLRYIWDRGFAVAMNLTWITLTNMNDQQAMRIARYLYARYGAFNIIWGVSGEFNHDKASSYWSENNYARIRTVGNSVKALNDIAYRHPVSIHPAAGPWIPQGAYSSHYLMHDEPWLDHNWLQTYSLTERIPSEVRAAYNASPAKPVISAEPCYENSARLPYEELCTPYLVRWQAWTALLSGAAGHVYGSEGVFFMTDANAIKDPGSSEMSQLVDFMGRIDWWRLDPTIDCVTTNGSAPSNSPDVATRLQTRLHPRCAGQVGALYAVYIPAGNSGNTIAVRNLSRGKYKAHWFDPRTGSSNVIDGGPTGVADWNIPSRPDDNDWVLLLQGDNGS